MLNKRLEQLSDLVEQAHAKIQQQFVHINPVVGINLGMRDVGIPADVMTIDCLKTGKRIIIVLHDQQPEIIQYQFSYKDQDPALEFETLASKNLSSEYLFDWMKSYFHQPVS
ncbi:MAG: hypothetical protein ACPGJI_01930 [Kangiellaceae bacterium]